MTSGTERKSPVIIYLKTELAVIKSMGISHTGVVQKKLRVQPCMK